MQIKFNDILELFELVNFGSPFDNEGYICTLTGQTYFHSHFGDNEEPLPGDIDDNKYLSIPHKQDLNLGINIALDLPKRICLQRLSKSIQFFIAKGLMQTSNHC